MSSSLATTVYCGIFGTPTIAIWLASVNATSGVPTFEREMSLEVELCDISARDMAVDHVAGRRVGDSLIVNAVETFVVKLRGHEERDLGREVNHVLQTFTAGQHVLLADSLASSALCHHCSLDGWREVRLCRPAEVRPRSNRRGAR